MSVSPNVSRDSDPENFFAELASLKRFPHKKFGNSCSTCLKEEKDTGRLMRRCSKCHATFYCSTECQAWDWPSHKKTCGDGQAAASKRLPKLVQGLLQCPVLYLQLQLCFILAFDLLQNARCDEPLHARVDIAVEPADIADFEDIFRGKSPKKKVQGMVQVNTFTVVTGVDSRAARRLEIWRRERARADAAGFHADAIGSIQVSVSDGYAESGVDASIRIYSAFVKMWTSCYASRTRRR
ncbi:hypothetical protein B0H14DRAFT_3685632 [Mycena olivaceomarginata]|nr:hypothetical protein B0H14DRAFT_3685632 [Mycena olivaceomarginata]